MKVAFFNTGARIDNPNYKLRSMRSEALQMYNIESVGYAPTNLNQTFILKHTDGKAYTVVLPCSVPLLSKLGQRLGKSFIRNVVRVLENFAFAVRVAWRLPKDKIDVYAVLHLWDYEIPFLNLILRAFRPTIIIWFGGSLRWYLQSSNWRYHIFVSIYRLSLRAASLTLVSLDPEQEYYLFRILKLPKNKVVNFKEFVVDEKLFRRFEKNASAEKVGFDRNDINIVMVTRIETPERIAPRKDYEKDPFTALEVIRYLAEKVPKIKFHVFGGGQGMEEFKRRVIRYNLEDKVKIYGYLERDRLPEYYSAADLSFFPFPFITVNDGQANHESMLCGTPVIFFKRYAWVRTEHQGGFAVDRNPELAASQILPRLDPTYLQKKREEIATIPRDFTIEAFGYHMAEILKQFIST
jgi:glycosyltransferase involved in cell wall biosynthesis